MVGSEPPCIEAGCVSSRGKTIFFASISGESQIRRRRSFRAPAPCTKYRPRTGKSRRWRVALLDQIEFQPQMKSKSEKGKGAARLTALRQLIGRNATKYSAGGREKRVLRPVPSLPRLKCLESAGGHDESRSE
jgi:hypothetical protein